MDFTAVKQVGWIRVGALGDLLIATSALKETCARFPASQIWVIGPRLWLELISPELWPQISGIIALEGHQLGQLYQRAPEKKSRLKSAGSDEVSRVGSWQATTPLGPLSHFIEKCEAIVNHRIESYRYSWTPWLRRVPIRVGSCPWPMQWLYTHWSPWLGKDPLLHERDWHLYVARAEARSGERPSVEEARELFARHMAERPPEPGLPLLKTPSPHKIAAITGSDHQKYVLFNPTSSRWEKAWPKERFAELILRIKPELETAGLNPLVIGSPKETDWLTAVAEPAQAKVIQPENLQELMDVVSGARLLVTNTSSMQFIAAAQKTQTLTLMGQANPKQWGPLGARDVVLVGQVPSDFRGSLFERDFAAYESISVERVHRAIANLLGDKLHG